MSRWHHQACHPFTRSPLHPADDDRHYEWVDGALERLVVERGGLIDTVQDAVETVHGRAADAIRVRRPTTPSESAGRRVAEAARAHAPRRPELME